MIVVYAACHIKPGSLEEFKEAATPLVEGSRAEEGCLGYDLCMENDELVAFVERWKDQAAMDQHGKSPHFLSAVASFGNLLTAPLDIHQMTQIV